MQIALQKAAPNIDKVMECYNRYMEFVVDKIPTYKQFVQNMELKMEDPDFLHDTELLLRTDSEPFDPATAYQLVKETFIERMPGKRE